jgi:hypothetical protein
MNEMNLSELSTPELLALHAKLADELRTRGIIRSANNPTGISPNTSSAERLDGSKPAIRMQTLMRLAPTAHATRLKGGASPNTTIPDSYRRFAISEACISMFALGYIAFGA